MFAVVDIKTFYLFIAVAAMCSNRRSIKKDIYVTEIHKLLQITCQRGVFLTNTTTSPTDPNAV